VVANHPVVVDHPAADHPAVVDHPAETDHRWIRRRLVRRDVPPSRTANYPVRSLH
jgi:hypothetical protein